MAVALWKYEDCIKRWWIRQYRECLFYSVSSGNSLFATCHLRGDNCRLQITWLLSHFDIVLRWILYIFDNSPILIGRDHLISVQFILLFFFTEQYGLSETLPYGIGSFLYCPNFCSSENYIEDRELTLSDVLPTPCRKCRYALMLIRHQYWLL